jgi:AraC-like DNA-binding protein
MRVLSLLGPTEHQHLLRIVRPTWVVRAVSVRVAIGELNERAVGAVAVDPTDISSDTFESLTSAAAAAGTRMVVCGDADSWDLRRLIWACRASHIEPLMASVDTTYADAATLLEGPSRSTTAQLLRAASPLLSLLRERVSADAIRQLTYSGPLKTPGEICRGLDIHQTTLVDWFRDAGLCSPRAYCAIARVARACHFVDASVLDNLRVAYACGFHRARPLSEACERMLGAPLAALRRDGVPRSAAAILAAQIGRSE